MSRKVQQHRPIPVFSYYNEACHSRWSIVTWTSLVFPTTLRSTAADGDSMDHFLVSSVTMRSAVEDGDSMDHFVVFSLTMRSAAADGDSMDHFGVFSVDMLYSPSLHSFSIPPSSTPLPPLQKMTFNCVC